MDSTLALGALTDFLAEGAGWGASPGPGGELECQAQQVLKKIREIGVGFSFAGLRSAHELGVLARGLITDLAVGTRVVGGEERSDDELAGLDGGDCAAGLFDDTAVLVTHRGRLGNRLDAAVRP